ncbi:hypothetical protein SCHPADRAFT_1001470 [Schizopora paradoxa]|uniref:F-box domain-containing protein n=1 Tax=Schizopora paradoxa TaxID=27342 RepID=A0A0H2RS99_9AGAM|nr:hypothetical protein SCHPADRAFT_1001470 [Schizopora paradoxa]
MGWRKLGDDGQELCRQLDYLVGGVQVLKTSIQMRRLVNAKELWCGGLYRDIAGDDLSVDVTYSKAALRHMKDARFLLSTLLDSLDHAIHIVSKDIAIDCQAFGLTLLPDDVLTNIFESYVETSVTPDGRVDPGVSPQILASVCKRFRQIALAHSNLWQRVSLRFSSHLLLLHKTRCQAPIVFMDADDAASLADAAAKLEVAHPNRNWQELHLTYADENLGHLSYGLLKQMIQTPFEALEYLSICNDTSIRNENRYTITIPIHMEPGDSDILCSWEMPKLTNLQLYNVYPLNPLQSENVTHFTFEVDRTGVTDLDTGGFCRLLQSMPNIQAFSLALNADFVFTNGTPTRRLALPCLESFELKVGEETPVSTVKQLRSILDVQHIRRLSLQCSGCFNCDEEFLNLFIVVLTPYVDKEGEPESQFPFVKLENFILEVQHLQGSNVPFGRLFQAMPNVQHITLKLPGTADPVFDEAWKDPDNNILRYLRTLRLAPPQSSPNDFSCQLSGIEEFFSDGYCQDFERLEVHFRPPYNSATSKARLLNILGEKLRWIEC